MSPWPRLARLIAAACRSMRILVTGAGGFIGSALLKSLMGNPAAPEIVAIDLAERPTWTAADRVRWICGGVDDCAIMDEIFRDEFNLVFHLSSVPGALAEADPRLGRRVNLDASLDLLERLAATSCCPRVVYASSIAVYGPSSGPVGSRTPPRPAISYGAHKRMVEIALADHSRRGEMSGISVRLPGIVARPGPASGFGSAFMSELLQALAAGEPYCCPVSPSATMWWLSVAQAVNNLIHAGAIAHCGAVQLPALQKRSSKGLLRPAERNKRRSFSIVRMSASRRHSAASLNWTSPTSASLASPTTARSRRCSGMRSHKQIGPPWKSERHAKRPRGAKGL